jgi:hypothetical protein
MQHMHAGKHSLLRERRKAESKRKMVLNPFQQTGFMKGFTA